MAVWTGYSNRLTPVLDDGVKVATDVYRSMMLYLTGYSNEDWTPPSGLFRSGSYLYLNGTSTYSRAYSQSSSSSTSESSSESSSQSTSESSEEHSSTNSSSQTSSTSSGTTSNSTSSNQGTEHR